MERFEALGPRYTNPKTENSFRNDIDKGRLEWFDFYYLVNDRLHGTGYNAASNVTGVLQYFQTVFGLTRNPLDYNWKHQELYYNDSDSDRNNDQAKVNQIYKLRLAGDKIFDLGQEILKQYASNLEDDGFG